MIGDFIYNNKNASITYDSIALITNPIYESIQKINVKSNGIEAICYENCNIEFSSKTTPILNSVTPILFNQTNMTLTIKGENFGNDTSQIEVNVGAQLCDAISSNETLIQCILENLEFGNQKLVVKRRGKLLLT